MIPDRIAIALLGAVPADEIATLNQKIGEISDRLNYFVSLFSSVSAFMGVGITVFIGLITVVLGIATFFGVQEARRLRATNQSLEKLTKDQADALYTLREQSRQNDHRFQERLSDISQQFKDLQNSFDERVEKKIRFLQEFIAGQLAYRGGDYAVALSHFDSAKKVDADNIENIMYLARCHTYLDHNLEAVALYEEVAHDHPNNPHPFRGLGLAHRFTQPKIAAAKLEKASQLARNGDRSLRAKIENERGLVYRDQGKIDESRMCHLSAKGMQAPQDILTTYFLGIVDILAGRQTDGIRELQRAAANVPAYLESQDIRPIWGSVILWSAAFLDEDDDLRKYRWAEIEEQIRGPYLRQTVRAHADSLAKGTGQELSVELGSTRKT